MRKGLFIFLSIIIWGSFFIPQKTHAANSDIVINEIGAYATSTHEWVEIYNKGSDSVNLTGWKFWEASTNHGLTAANGGDFTVSPGEYAAIVQDAAQFIIDHPGFSGSILDSSWSSLSESGEEIGLKDASANVIEQFTYLATPNHHSLERKNAALADYTSNNWQEHTSGDTVGSQNSSGGGSTPPPNTSGTGTADSGGRSTGPTGSDALFFWSKIKINEIMVDPGGASEWVELYNPSTTNLDITGGTLCDGRTGSTCTIAALSGSIAAGGWRVITITSDHLNNSGDTVILKDFNGGTVDQVIYGGSLLPKTGQALARKVDGVDSNSDSADWAVTTQPTAGSANVIIAPVASNAATPTASQGGSQNPLLPEEGSASRPGVVGALAWATSTSPLILNELLPDPEGSDLTDEFIEIKNISSANVNLAGWKLGDTTKTFSLTGVINAGELAVFSRPVTGLALNNSTDEEVRLYNASGAVADSIAYDSAEPGKSYSRMAEGDWRWTVFVTKGSNNYTASKINPVAQKDDEVILTTTTTPAPPAVLINVTFSEIFPNPIGADKDEFIELYNNASSAANLSGWRLRLKSGKTFVLPEETVIFPGSAVIFYQSTTKLTLKNTDETIELINPTGQVTSRVSYAKSVSGQSYSRVGAKWLWTAPSPGSVAANAPKILGQKITARPAASASRHLLNGIQEIRELAKGTPVRFSGLVTALPGTFSRQYFYVSDGSAGIQVYSNKKTFPELALGDQVAIAGKTSAANSIPRVNISRADDVDILSINGVLAPEPLVLDEIEDANVGSLRIVSGEITKLTSNLMYVDDSRGEIAVYFKAGAKIDKSAFNVSDQVKVMGIIERAESGLQLWPRSQNDIEIVSIIKPDEKASSPSSPLRTYGLVTMAGASALALAWWIKKRAA